MYAKNGQTIRIKVVTIKTVGKCWSRVISVVVYWGTPPDNSPVLSNVPHDELYLYGTHFDFWGVAEFGLQSPDSIFTQP